MKNNTSFITSCVALAVCALAGAAPLFSQTPQPPTVTLKSGDPTPRKVWHVAKIENATSAPVVFHWWDEPSLKWEEMTLRPREGTTLVRPFEIKIRTADQREHKLKSVRIKNHMPTETEVRAKNVPLYEFYLRISGDKRVLDLRLLPKR